MSVVRTMSTYEGQSKTSLKGTVDSDCTYEFVDGDNGEYVLILRTTSHDIIHIPERKWPALLKIIVDQMQ